MQDCMGVHVLSATGPAHVMYRCHPSYVNKKYYINDLHRSQDLNCKITFGSLEYNHGHYCLLCVSAGSCWGFN